VERPDSHSLQWLVTRSTNDQSTISRRTHAVNSRCGFPHMPCPAVRSEVFDIASVAASDDALQEIHDASNSFTSKTLRTATVRCAHRSINGVPEPPLVRALSQLCDARGIDAAAASKAMAITVSWAPTAVCNAPETLFAQTIVAIGGLWFVIATKNSNRFNRLSCLATIS
jgi:hypothetical protein